MEIHLVRHGETEWSKSGRHTSVTDLDLTDDGVAQAQAWRGWLKPTDYDLVLSSPRLRARRTAELIGFADIQIEDGLQEWHYGDYEGLTRAQIRQRDPGWTIWTHDTPGGETADHVAQRMQRLIERIHATGAQRVICFSHGHALRALSLTWLGFDFALGDQFPLSTATWSVLGDYKEQRALVRWNATPASA